MTLNEYIFFRIKFSANYSSIEDTSIFRDYSIRWDELFSGEVEEMSDEQMKTAFLTFFYDISRFYKTNLKIGDTELIDLLAIIRSVILSEDGIVWEYYRTHKVYNCKNLYDFLNISVVDIKTHPSFKAHLFLEFE
jgi:hypothetical protein